MKVQAEPLQRLIARTFESLGCPAGEGGMIGRRLVSANLFGHDSHGVVRVPRYAEWLNSGHLVAGQKMAIISDSDCMAVVDGKRGFGQSIGTQATEMGIAKAQNGGLSLIALRRSGHLGRIGDWAEMAAEAGLISIHFVNVGGSRLVAPFGAVDRRMSTNPVAIGVPRPGEEPLVLDFATSMVAEGKVLVAARGGKPVPEGALISDDGKLSTDPYQLYGKSMSEGRFQPMEGSGALRTMGEHKGAGLSFMCEILAGALTGSGCAGPQEQATVNGMLSIYIAPSFFESEHDFAASMREYVDFYKSARPANEDSEILVPGEPERRTRDDRLENGVPLADEVWNAILDTARSAGLSQSDIGIILDGA